MNIRHKGFTLIELLTVIVIIAVLSGILLPAVSKAFLHAKAWIWGCYAFNEHRIEAFLDDSPMADQKQMEYATNQPKPWSFIKVVDETNIVVIH